MADSILRLKVESQEYDNKLKQAAQGLTRYVDQCRKVGGTLEVVEKDTLDYVRALGQMDTVSRTATGKLAEMKKAFVELSAQYKQMTDAEKASPMGKALAASLDQLKPRIQESKAQLESINRELSGSKFGQFGSIIDSLGQKMGLNVNITELLTSKTALLSAGIGAAGAIVGKATQEWAKYNAELAKQDQITTVTTGLKGADSDRMTNQARALTDTYGVDFREAINAANTLMTQFGQTGEQAMSLISDGMQGMIQGDGPKLLSMIQQYAPAFRDAGVSASQLVAVIQNSEGGIFTDQNMNAIVMGIKNIRLMTNATREALGKLGIDGQKMSQQLRDGSLTIFDALKQVATQIQSVNSNSQAAGEVMQQVFGRQGAMAGTKLGEAIATLNTNLEETKRQTGEVGDAYNDLYNANVKLNGAIRDCFEYDGWDQMATGIKANLVSALASVLNYLGKIKGALGGFSVNQQQGETRNGGGQFIDRAVDRLRGGNTPGKQQIYTRQIQAYSGKILDINDQIRQIQEKAAQDMDGNMAVVYEKQIRNLENRKQAIQRNMAEYNKRAQAVLNGTETTPAPIINPITNTTQKGGGKGGTVKITSTQEVTYASDSIVAQQKLVQDLTKKWNEAGASVRNQYIQPIVEAEAKLKQMKDEQTLLKEQAQGKLLGGEVEVPIKADVTSSLIPTIDQMRAELASNPIKIPVEAAEDKVRALKDTAKTTAQVVGTIGQAFNAIEDPAAKVAAVVAQAIANVALAYSDALAKTQAEKFNIWGFIAAAAASTVSMVSTIASIHSATGYAQGGMIKGNSYSGDNIGGLVDGSQLVGLNAGELVLNAAQQNNVAQNLEGAGARTVRVIGKIHGTDIILSADRTLMEQGKQLAVWGRG